MGKIVRQGVEYGGSSNSADCIKYNETKSVKEAIDEIKSSSSSNPTAASVTFDNTDTGLAAANVQDAVTEVNGKLGNESFSLQSGTSAITPVGSIALYDKASKTVFIAFAVLGSRKADEVIYIVPEKYRPSNNVQGVCILKTSSGDVTMGICSIGSNGYCTQNVTNADTNCIMCIFNYGI